MRLLTRRRGGGQEKDLSEWRDNPEQFHHESDVGSWQDNLRVCAEALLLALLERSRAAVAPVVLAVAQAACGAAPTGASEQLAASGAPMAGAPRGAAPGAHTCLAVLAVRLRPRACPGHDSMLNSQTGQV